jgi:phytoene dehydrogenase-like protein
MSRNPLGLFPHERLRFDRISFEDERVKTALTALGLAISPKPSQVYSGAIGVLTALASSGSHSSFTARGGSYNLAHSGLIFTRCEVEKIIVNKNGEAEAVKLSSKSAHPNATIKARKAIVSNHTAVPTFLHLVGEEYLEQKVVSALKKFDYTGHRTNTFHRSLRNQ